jgi:hypothetical protein
VFYLAAKAKGVQAARGQIRRLLELFEVAPVGRAVLESALAGLFSDFEDGVLYEAGRHFGVDGIVTRNGADFAHSQLPIFSPAELETLLSASPPH